MTVLNHKDLLEYALIDITVRKADSKVMVKVINEGILITGILITLNKSSVTICAT